VIYLDNNASTELDPEVRDAIAAALLRPLRATLIPALARSPEELVAANVATTTGDSLAALAGPAVAALLLAAGGSIATTFVAGIVAMVVALVSVAGIAAAGALRPQPRAPAAATSERPVRAGPSPLAVVGELVALRHARLVVVCFVAQRLVRGMLAVLIVAGYGFAVWIYQMLAGPPTY